MADNKVSVELTIEERDALRSIKNLQKSIDDFAKSAESGLGKAESGFSSFGQTTAAVFAGGALLKGAELLISSIAKIPGALADVVQAGVESEDATRRLSVALAQSGEFSEKAVQDFDALASSISLLIGVEDEAVISGITLAKSLGATNEQAAKIATTAADVSSALGKDFNEVVQQLSQTLQGSSGRLGKLSSDIKDLDETALKSGAAIDILSSKFRGFATLNADNLGVQIQNVGVQFGELAESIGKSIATTPAIRGLFSALVEALGQIKSSLDANKEPIQAFFSGLVEGSVTATAGLAAFIDTTAKVGAVVKNVFELGFGTIKAAFDGLAGTVNTVVSAFNTITGLAPPDTAPFQALDQSIKELAQDSNDLQKALGPEAYLPGTQAVFDFAANVETATLRASTADQKRVDTLKALSAEEIAQRQAVKTAILANQAEIDAILTESALVAGEREVLLRDAATANQTQELEALQAFEQAKLDAKFAAETAKAQLITDSVKREQELSKIGAQQTLANEQLKTKQQLDEYKKRKAFQDANNANTLAATQNFIQSGLNLAKDGSAAQKALQSASAIVSTYTAANQALSSPPGPPFTLPLVASTIALGLSNLAKINSVKFAQGGIVPGASTVGDRVPALMNSGEMVLNKSQQSELFSLANGGGSGGNSVTEAIRLLGDRIAGMTITVQANSREIARLVRDERESGFAI